MPNIPGQQCLLKKKKKKTEKRKRCVANLFQSVFIWPRTICLFLFFLLNRTKGGMYENVLVIKMMYCDWSVSRYLSMTQCEKGNPSYFRALIRPEIEAQLTNGLGLVAIFSWYSHCQQMVKIKAPSKAISLVYPYAQQNWQSNQNSYS